MSELNIRKTDLIRSTTFSEITNSNLFLKLECLQKTGSFKVRGAMFKINNLSKDLKKQGVVAASAGNHAQAVAFASSIQNISCVIVMPKNSSPSKILATRSYGAKVILEGNSYDEAAEYVKEFAREENRTIIHAFDDSEVIAGQGTVGLEILEELSDVDEIYVPVGGGGLISGVAIAAKSSRPKVKIIGVESTAYPTMRESLKKKQILKVEVGHTIADGISIKTPSQLTFNLVKDYVDEIVLVDDPSIVKTMFLLMERSKIVAEAAGAASLAYLISKPELLKKDKKIVSIISGGNVDMYLLGQIVSKGLMQTGRLLKIFVDLPDKPGALKKIVDEITKANINIVEVEHDRLSANVPAGTAGVYLSLELENSEKSETLINLFEKEKIAFNIMK
ncbi:threonine ammonia-lyase [Candidatus Nitrosocosmicus franklandus]|uniref:threonine ammonia-lyase n=1 Tax=Candidatus Nitrosocosmicus franklandianus TaxID=1798806 RepID=A0A484IGW5_9ARCH|nr:L-threonine ammonia-lyase [Candidatus Nitrosocosmicus franklandus]